MLGRQFPANLSHSRLLQEKLAGDLLQTGFIAGFCSNCLLGDFLQTSLMAGFCRKS